MRFLTPHSPAGPVGAYSFCNGHLVLSGEIVPMLYFADTDEVWMRATQIHTFTGAATMAQTLQRVDSEGKRSLKELIRRKGMPPRVGVLNTPPPNPDDYHEGKALYVNEPGFYSVVLGSQKPECPHPSPAKGSFPALP